MLFKIKQLREIVFFKKHLSNYFSCAWYINLHIDGLRIPLRFIAKWVWSELHSNNTWTDPYLMITISQMPWEITRYCWLLFLIQIEWKKNHRLRSVRLHNGFQWVKIQEDPITLKISCFFAISFLLFDHVLFVKTWIYVSDAEIWIFHSIF